MKFAKWVFTLGGIWGVLIIGPLFFLEGLLAKAGGPFSHPDMYYGFVASTFAWQLVYLLIGRNPGAYRPLMLLGALGKVIYATSTWVLYAQGRLPISIPLITLPDLLLASLFVTAYLKTKPVQE